MRSRVGQAARMLREAYADFAHYNRRNPFEELVFILCSVQTQEANYRRTFRALRMRFRTFAGLARADASEIAKPLLSGGLYRHKANRLKEICAMLVNEFGRPTLAPLRQMDDVACEEFLTSLPGVGLKVARCVMMYSLDRQVFPVDTHCWRICRRLGWVRSTRAGVCTRQDMNRLQDKIPAQWRFSMHVNMISLGREFCVSDRPRCEACPLRSLCRRGRGKRSD